MLKTVFMIGLFAIGALFLLKLAFGILGFFFVFLLGVLRFAIFAAIVGAVIYLVIRVVSPDTARRLRERWSGTGI
jgi:hypothetical protein